ncbi:MAG: transglycosylase domain-containing protein [Bacteroidales bacterium]|nr:penicillin-binding protein [Bacteroidales bacterium]MBQ2917651.1 transglycosylase domain-containing protein [Bacteroidales bacterium]
MHWRNIMKETTKKKIIKWFWVLFTVPIVLVIGLIGMVWAFADIPSFEELESPDSNLATQVIADDGSTILSTFHIENRSYVTYDELSPNLVQAAVATEDVRFYNHSGIDFKSLGRVIFKTLLGGDSSQGGGSTITQQLAKTLYPREDVSSRIPGVSTLRMVGIKLKEWVTAVKLERSYTKNEIITMYMNQVFFGSNAYGIKAAAQTFFAKTPSDLTVEEAATLVGMVNKPTRYNPALNPDKSLVRRNFVISQMEKAGYLSKDQRDSIQQIPITLSYQVQDHTAGSGLYFRDMLRRVMNAEEPKRSSYSQYEDFVVDSLLWAEDDLYGWLNKNVKPDGSKYDIYRDGLRIYTTINPKMQKYAEEAVRQHIGQDMQKRFMREVRWKNNPPFDDEVEKKMIDGIMKRARRDSDRYRRMKAAGVSESQIMKSFTEPVQMRVFAWNKNGYADTTMTPDDSIRYYKAHIRASFIAMTPDEGHIKAYVGGTDFKAFQYDNARQSKRQVGSTIKPFLYTLAMQEGMSPCDQVANVPQTFIISEDKVWTPKSTDRDEYIGNMVTLKWGLAKSSNNISAYLMKQYGPEAMVEMMRKMGVGSFLDPVPPLCVGSANISLYEMVAAYNTFPSKGVYVRPMFVTRIVDNMGNVLAEFNTRKKEAISDRTAYLMANLMQGVVNGGTGYALRSRFGFTGEIAGKTGTTNDNADGWFIGYTPQLTAGAWAGFEDMQVHFNRTGDGGGAGAALPIWGLFMQKVQKDPSLARYYHKTAFDVPVGYELNLNCDGSGEVVADDGMTDVVKDDFEEEMENYFE